MPDREKVIKGLEHCIASSDCRGCPYFKQIEEDGNLCALRADALSLLKEQEAVEPQTQPSAKGYWFTCGACGWWLFEVRDTVHFDDRKRIRFCASCGKKVKWE